MKKALSMILAAMTAAALCAGCGNSGQGTPQTQAPAAASPESSAGQAEAGESSQAGLESPAPEGSLKAAFITPQALGDGSVTDLSYSGFTRAAEEWRPRWWRSR